MTDCLSQVRIEAGTPYYRTLRQAWHQGFREIFGRLAPFHSNFSEAMAGGDRGIVDVDEGSHHPG